MIRFTDLSLYWPEVVRFRNRVATRYRPKTKTDCVVILPCSKRKPYSQSRSHRLFSEVISPSRRRVSIREIILTSPLGAVPRELEGVPPARSYDISVTGMWSEEELILASESLATVLKACADGETRVVAHVKGGYEECCRRSEATLGWQFNYTRAESPTSVEGLQCLSQTLENLEGSPMRIDGLDAAAQVLSYQYGTQVAGRMIESPSTLKVTRKTESILRNGRKVARRNPTTGFFIPQEEGLRILSRLNSYCVDLDFRPEKRVIYSPGVSSADAAIRPGDEVAVRWEGKTVGQGRSFLSGGEMTRSDRGRAVILRELLS